MSGQGERRDESVVVVDANVGSSVACVRSLGRRGIRTIVASEDSNAASFCSNYCDEAVVTPSPAEDVIAYKNALRSLAERSDVRTIVPVREADVYVLSKYKDEFEPHVGTPWPSFDALGVVRDRMRLLAAAEEVGVSVPATLLFDEVDEWNRRAVVKSRYTLQVDGNRTDYRPVEFVKPGERPDEARVVSEMGHVPIVQEYMDGLDEYSVLALYDRGTPVATAQHRQVRGTNYSGGTSTYRVTIRDPALEAAGLGLLDHLDWHGPAEVEFKKDGTTGEFKLLEVNPRFWASLPLHVQAGVDFPYYYWLMATGRADQIESEYEVGVGCHFLLGEFKHLLSVLTDDIDFVGRPSLGRRTLEIARSIYDDPQFDYLSLDDPCPFGRAALNNVDKLWAGR